MRIERYVVWSPEAAPCMTWAKIADAQRFMRYWNQTALLGRTTWRMSAVVALPAREAAPREATIGLGASGPASDAANDRCVGRDRDREHEHEALLADKDALIDALQRRLNDSVLGAARDAATRTARIAELEARVMELERRGPRSVG